MKRDWESGGPFVSQVFELQVSGDGAECVQQFHALPIGAADVVLLIATGGCGQAILSAVALEVRSLGALVIAVVHAQSTAAGVESELPLELRSPFDAVLLASGDDDLGVTAAIAARAISEYLGDRNLICAGIEDVRVLFRDGTWLRAGSAVASGEDRVAQAAQQAFARAGYLDNTPAGCSGALVSLAVPGDATVAMAHQVFEIAASLLPEDAPHIGGVVVDDELGDEVRVVAVVAYRSGLSE